MQPEIPSVYQYNQLCKKEGKCKVINSKQIGEIKDAVNKKKNERG